LISRSATAEWVASILDLEQEVVHEHRQSLDAGQIERAGDVGLAEQFRSSTTSLQALTARSKRSSWSALCCLSLTRTHTQVPSPTFWRSTSAT
jgi:hypothetical protein